MDTNSNHTAEFSMHTHWRHATLSLIVIGFAAYVASLPSIPQNLAYHNFADTRSVLNVPNFLDVVSNVPFLVVGVAGIIVCCVRQTGTSRVAWLTLFLGVAMVSFGSAWYHWQPTNASLVWDRLPMTIGFMGLFAALLGEYVSERLGIALLVPALLTGFASVLYWHWFDDLRMYIFVQITPLMLILVVILLFKARWSHQYLLVLALGFYVLAKVAEFYDHQLFALSAQTISGHSLKHILAALGCCALVIMITVRRPLAANRTPTNTDG